MYLFINSIRRTINFYYVSIDFFFYKFDSMFEFLRTKITPIILFFILSLFRSILGNKSVTRNFLPVVYRWMEHHRAIARSSSFLNGIASKNATNSRIVITRPRYPRIIDIREGGREGIHIYSHYSTKSSRSCATIRVIGISRWEKCMLIQNARLYHDVLHLSLSLSLEMENGTVRVDDCTALDADIYIYTRTLKSFPLMERISRKNETGSS